MKSLPPNLLSLIPRSSPQSMKYSHFLRAPSGSAMHTEPVHDIYFFLLKWWHTTYTVLYLVSKKHVLEIVLGSFCAPSAAGSAVFHAASCPVRGRWGGWSAWNTLRGSLSLWLPAPISQWWGGGQKGDQREGGEWSQEMASLPPSLWGHPRLATSLHWALLPSRPPLSLQVVLWSWGGWEPAGPNPRLQRSPLWVLLCLSTPLRLVPDK